MNLYTIRIRRILAWTSLVAAALVAVPNVTRAQQRAPLYFGIVATETNPADKQAIAKAQEAFDALAQASADNPARKAEETLAKSLHSPAYPNAPEPKEQAGPSAAALAAAAALPQMGLGDAVLSRALLGPAKSQPVATTPKYRWVRLLPREMAILGLGKFADADVRTTQAEARDKGAIYVHPRFKFALFCRKAQPDVYFILVREPDAEEAVTNAMFQQVQLRGGEDNPVCWVFLSDAGKQQLKLFTQRNMGNNADQRFVSFAYSDRNQREWALGLMSLDRVVNDGRIEFSAETGFRPSDVKQTFTILNTLVPRRTAPR